MIPMPGVLFPRLGPTLPVLACLALALGTLSVAPGDVAAGETGSESGADSLNAADSLAAQGREVGAETGVETGAVRAKRPAVPEKLWVTHPTYNLTISKRKDVTNWDSKIVMTKELSSKLSFSMSGTVTSRENSTLNRLDANNATSAMVRYKLTDQIDLGMNYGANVSAYSYDLKGGKKPSDKKKNEDVTVSSQLARRLFDVADFDMKVAAGTTSNSFASVSNTGRRQDLTASLGVSPIPGLRTSTTFTGTRLFLDSRVDTSGGNPFTTEDKTYTNRIAFTLAYDVMPGIQFGMDASEGTNQRQHPDPDSLKQETERKSNKSASVTSTFGIIPRVTWDVGVSFNRNENTYVLRSSSNSKSRGAKINASGKIDAWRGAQINFGGSRTDSRDEYQTDDTGNTLEKSLNMRLTQDLGEKADLNFTALSDLISISYDNKVTNQKDRDRLSNRLSVGLTYLPFPDITTEIGGEYAQEHSIYVKGASSANNRNQTRYRVTGSYKVNAFREIKITQTYEIGAVYSLYEFDPNANSLVRNSNVTTRFDVPISTRVPINIDHTYRYQDQGGYQEVGGEGEYSRAAGNQTNTFALGTSYAIGGFMFRFRQSYYKQDSWNYKAGKKVFKAGNWSVDLSGRAEFKFEIQERTRVSFSIQRNRTEGSNVGEAFKRYWNIELEASHVF